MNQIKNVTLRFTGDYDFNASVAIATRAAFASPMRSPGGADGPRFLDLAFPLEGSWSPIGVSIEQTRAGVVAHIAANPDEAGAAAIRDRLEHILALDVDAAGYAGVAKRDKVVGALIKHQPGVRPILFASPYEAAARAIIGHRLQVRQAAAVQARLAEKLGTAVEIDGKEHHAFPAPARLARLTSVQGLSDQKVQQLRALGSAADEGWLDSKRLADMPFEVAMAHLQKLAGIGPFSAELILLRGVGDADAFPASEMRLHRAMAAAYDLGKDPDFRILLQVAEHWRPYRSWVGLLLRNAETKRDDER